MFSGCQRCVSSCVDSVGGSVGHCANLLLFLLVVRPSERERCTEEEDAREMGENSVMGDSGLYRSRHVTKLGMRPFFASTSLVHHLKANRARILAAEERYICTRILSLLF